MVIISLGYFSKVSKYFHSFEIRFIRNQETRNNFDTEPLSSFPKRKKKKKPTSYDTPF